MKVLILLSSEFPEGKAETYLEREFEFLKPKFDSIYIVPTYIKYRSEKSDSIHGEVVLHSKISGIENNFFFLKTLFSYHLYQEFYRLIFVYGMMPNAGRSKTIFRSLMHGFEIKKTLDKIVLNHKNDQVIIYTYWNDSSAVAVSLIKLAFPEIRFVSRAHGWDFYFYRNLYGYLPYKQFIYKHLDSLFLISNQAKNYLQSGWKLKKIDKSQIARLGVLPVIKNSDLKRKEFTMVSVSGLIPLKRVHLIIEALALIHDLEIRWIHFGEGVLKENLIQKASAELSRNVKVEFRGYVSQIELYRFYESELVDLFVNVSQFEGVPVSIMEAFAAGIPAVATNVGAVAEIVNDKNGYLLPGDFSADELAEIIRFSVHHPAELKSKSAYALATWKDLFNAEKNYQEFVNQLLEL